jgi:hypothetical protein
MGYDIKDHLQGQVEAMLSGLVQVDDGLVERSISNIKDIMDQGFVDKLDDYKKRLDAELKHIDKTTVNLIKTGSEVKTLNDIATVLSQANQEAVGVYNEYLIKIKSFIISYVKQVK